MPLPPEDDAAPPKSRWLKSLLPANLFSLEGVRAFGMPAFYRFFAKWLFWVLLVTYAAVLIPIKITATKALHVSDARVALLLLQNAMFDTTLATPLALQDAAPPAQALRKPLTVEAGLERLRHSPYVTFSPVTTPLRVSGMPPNTHCLQPEYACYRLLMNRKYNHAGVFAYNLKRQELSYDVDGGMQLRRHRFLQAFNVMTLFPLIDGRPFYFSVLPNQRLRPILNQKREPRPNYLRGTPKLYGIIPLFEKKDLTNQDISRLVLFNTPPS
jgi:hypothetical protein